MLDFKNAKDTVTQGNMGLGLAISYFTMNGYVVSLPLNDNQKYDLIVEINNKLCKVQVKTTRFRVNNKYVVQLKSVKSNRNQNIIENFEGEKIDYLFIVTEEGIQYLIPTNSSTPKSAISLGDNYKLFIVN